MSKVRDLPPVSGSIIWARQVSTTWIYCSLTYKLYDVSISSKALLDFWGGTKIGLVLYQGVVKDKKKRFCTLKRKGTRSVRQASI